MATSSWLTWRALCTWAVYFAAWTLLFENFTPKMFSRSHFCFPSTIFAHLRLVTFPLPFVASRTEAFISISNERQVLNETFRAPFAALCAPLANPMSAAMMATQGNTERDDTVTIDGRRYRLNVPPSEQDDVRMITRRLSQAASRRGFNVHAVTFTKEELGFFARIYLRLYQVPGTNQKRLDLWFHAHPNERRDWDMDAFFNTVVFDEQNGSKPRRKPGIPWERQPAVPQQVGQSQQPAASLSSDDNGDNEGGDKEGDKEDGEVCLLPSQKKMTSSVLN